MEEVVCYFSSKVFLYAKEPVHSSKSVMKLFSLILPNAQVQGTHRSDMQHLNEVIKI